MDSILNYWDQVCFKTPLESDLVDDANTIRQVIKDHVRPFLVKLQNGSLSEEEYAEFTNSMMSISQAFFRTFPERIVMEDQIPELIKKSQKQSEIPLFEIEEVRDSVFLETLRYSDFGENPSLAYFYMPVEEVLEKTCDLGLFEQGRNNPDYQRLAKSIGGGQVLN